MGGGGGGGCRKRNIAKVFIERNNIMKHQFREKRTGAKLMHRFVKRNHLTLKKAELISSCQFSNTSNPFIVYDFYDTLEKVCFIVSEIFVIGSL